jgi:hypothetical protein
LPFFAATIFGRASNVGDGGTPTQGAEHFVDRARDGAKSHGDFLPAID